VAAMTEDSDDSSETEMPFLTLNSCFLYPVSKGTVSLKNSLLSGRSLLEKVLLAISE